VVVGEVGELRKTILIIFLLVMSSVAISAVEAEPEKGFVPNEFIIGVEDLSSSILLDIEESGGEVLELIPSLNALRVSVPSSMKNTFIKAMKSKARVRYVERNVIFEALHTPNDPYWSDQWGMRIIQADSAWDIHKGSTSVIVAIIDTGIEYTHDDLFEHYVALGYDWVNEDNDPMDDHGHGTHCAGIAAAVMDNWIGVVGVAQLSIMAEKVLGADGTGTADDVAQGIIHAADAGANVISISLGSYISSKVIRDACQYAWNKGSILVAAAGNDNVRWRHYPAAYDTVIAVAATDRYDGKASYSNYGNWIELSAPGGDGEDYHDWILSTYLNNWYAWGYGTSMAAPHVSGLAALVWSYEPSLTNQQLREHLRNTADDLGAAGKDPYYGYGRINAYRALNELQPPDNPPTCSIVDPVDGQTISSVYRVKVDATDDKQVSMVELSIDGGTWIDITANFDGTYYYYDWDTTTVSDGSHTLDAKATDNASQTTYASQVTVTVDNIPGGTMHVESIDFRQKGPSWLDILVTIYDDAGSPVTEATVYMDVTYPDGSVHSVSAVTNGNGVAKYPIRRPAKGTYTVTVTNVTHETLTYDPDANVETTDSYTVT
jgi:hypothetical protein